MDFPLGHASARDLICCSLGKGTNKICGWARANRKCGASGIKSLIDFGSLVPGDGTELGKQADGAGKYHLFVSIGLAGVAALDHPQRLIRHKVRSQWRDLRQGELARAVH